MDSPKLELTRQLKLPTGILGMSALDESSRTFVAACMDGVYLVHLQDESFEKLDDHGSYVSSAAVRGNIVLSAGYDGRLQWYDLVDRKRVRSLQLHNFWSWDMALSPDQQLVASVTGQYLAGGYKYEPKAETESSVKIVSADSGDLLHQLSHVPSVQAVAFSRDGQFVAAGNLMGEVRLWNARSGELESNWTTPDFTSWGIIKSHCYLGGIFAMAFSADGEQLLLAGMGPMRDPMAGNGRQLWQKWAWKESTPRKVDETHSGESGEGLMEALSVSPDGDQFVMGGRLRGGQWNVATFEMASGKRTRSLKTGYRVTDIRYADGGSTLIVVGTQGQPKDRKDGMFPHFGRVEAYTVA